MVESKEQVGSAQHSLEDDQSVNEDTRGVRAKVIAENLRAIHLVRADMLTSGVAVSNEHALRLLGPEQFLQSELESLGPLGRLALAEVMEPHPNIPGRKSL